MNKNDLRYKKTEIAIKEAYFALKSNTSKPVKVTELCEKAMINKTTFYTHYETIEALKKQVCREYTSEILDKCPDIEKMLTDTKTFVNSAYNLFLENQKMFFKLYENNIHALVDDIESELLKKFSDIGVSQDTEFAIRFCIGGALRLLISNQGEEQLNRTFKLVERFLELL